MRDFSSAVRHRLVDIDQNPSQLARQIGHTPQYVNDLLKGKRRWNEQVMGKVCDVLGLEIKIVPKQE